MLLATPVLLALTACKHHAPTPKVPSELQGDVPVRVTNAMSRDGNFVCIFSLGKSAMPSSWLNFRYASDFLRGGDSMEGRVKPGTYRMTTATCDVFLNVNSTVTQVVTIDSPTEVVVAIAGLSDGPHPAPPGYKTVNVSGAYKTDCIPDGERAQIDLPCCHASGGKLGDFCH